MYAMKGTKKLFAKILVGAAIVGFIGWLVGLVG